MRRTGHRAHHLRPSRTLGALALAMLALLLLSACSEELDQRAIQPGQVMLTPGAMSGTYGARSTSTTTSGAASPEVPGLPRRERIYFTRHGDLWQLPADDNLAAPVVTNRDILAFAPAPAGDRVAIAFRGENQQSQLAIVNADSTTALEVKPTASAGATPATGAGDVVATAWSPQGQSVAVAREDGSIVVIGIDGSARLVVAASPDAHPGNLSWSPDGRQLAYLDPALPGRPTSLYTVDVENGPPRRLVESSEAGRAVLAAAWLPASSDLLFIESSPSGVGRGGDLFEVDAHSGKQQLLVPAGQFAPVAGIMALAPSEDGRSLAFTVYVPGESHPVFQSLWVMDLATRATTQVATARDEAVTDLWWASGTLIYRSIPTSATSLPGAYTGTEPFALYQLQSPSATPVERYRST